MPPTIEVTLTVGQIGEVSMVQEFRGQCSVKPLHLALGLGMIRTAMHDTDPQAHEPDSQGGMGVIAILSPRRSVVDQYPAGHTVLLEDSHQLSPHGHCC